MQYEEEVDVDKGLYQDEKGQVVHRNIVRAQYRNSPSKASRWQQVLYVAYGIVAGLLALRFVFALLAANPGSTLARIVYDITQPLVAPFQNLFGVNAYTYGSSRFEYDTLAAILFYGFLTWIAAKVIGIDKDAARREATEQ